MGWDFGYRSKADIVHEVKNWDGVIEVLDPSTVDQRTWEAWGLYEGDGPDDIRLFVVIMEYDSHTHKWGQKVIEEEAGPYYYNVPLSFASRATTRNSDWRKEYLLKLERQMLRMGGDK